MHAEDIRLNIALGASGLDVEIASWQEVQRADNAFNKTSFPCHEKKHMMTILHK